MSAQTAGERLTYALEAAMHRGDRVPCAGRSEWVSESAEDRAEAVTACLSCPVTSLCAAAADEHGEKWGVWAGVDRGPRPSKTTSAGAAEKSPKTTGAIPLGGKKSPGKGPK